MPCNTVNVEGESAGGPVMSIYGATVEDTPVSPDGPAPTFIGSIENTGDSKGQAEMEIKVGSWVIGTYTRTISPAEIGKLGTSTTHDDLVNNVGTGQKTVTFTLFGGDGWSEQRETRTITIEESGGGGSTAIQVVDLAEPATTPSVGDDVEVTATLENTGDTGGTSSIPIMVNGSQVGTLEEYIGANKDGSEAVSFGIKITIPDTDPVSVSLGSESIEFPVDTNGGGKEPGGGEIIDQIIGFAKDNPYAVGAGALAAGYLVVGGEGGRTIIRSRPSRRASQPRSQGNKNTGTQK